jgi:hypothetical protein
MKVKAKFGSKRIGSGSDMSADQAACERVFDALERAYGKGIFSKRNGNSVDVALQEDGNDIIITIETDLPKEKVEAFRKAVPAEMDRAGFGGLGIRKPWWRFW